MTAHPTFRFRDLAKRRPPTSRLFWDNTTLHYSYNARGAIYQLCRALPKAKGQAFLLPAFHCPTVVEPVVRAGYRVLFYKINRGLSIDYEDLRRKLSNDIAAVLVINYCGFPTDLRCILNLREHYGFYLIEDCAHSFLSGEWGKLTGDRGDLAVYSFSKLVPSYIGGGLRINTHDFGFEPPSKPVGLRHAIVILKRLFEQGITNCDDGILKWAFQYVEGKRVARKRSKTFSAPPSPPALAEPYAFHESLACRRMPWFSRAILSHIDLEQVMSARRQNYHLLNAHLQENAHLHKVFSILPEHVCPWAYPVLVHDRAQHDYRLREMGIPVFTFGESLHPLLYKCESELTMDAEYLAKNLLMIPVHQNVSHDTVLQFSKAINTYFQDAS